MFLTKKLSASEVRAAAKAKAAAEIAAVKAAEEKKMAIANAKANFGKDFVWGTGPCTQFAAANANTNVNVQE